MPGIETGIIPLRDEIACMDRWIGFFFPSGMADHALRLGPYMRISCYQENCNMDTGGRMRTGKS